MGKLSRPRYGSLQFWPRKRVQKILPSVNWSTMQQEGLLGVIAYKAGMTSAIVKNNTKDSLTKGKKITIPVTVLEVPAMKIFSIRLYKHGKVIKDIIVSNDKELKRVVRLPKDNKHSLDNLPEHDDVRAIVYSMAKETGIKKTPDLVEVGVGAADKIAFLKNLVNKPITLEDFAPNGLVDARGVTKGKGLQGPVKRFGISFKSHKSEKGVRRPGSLAPWHPSRVTFRTPMAGQLGMFTRVHYNLKVINSGKAELLGKKEFRHYGFVGNSFVALEGSVQGPSKRAILLTKSYRPTKQKAKKEYEFVEFAK